MKEADRSTVLQSLDRRHDELLTELDALCEQVERVLTAVRPPQERVSVADRGGRTC